MLSARQGVVVKIFQEAVEGIVCVTPLMPAGGCRCMWGWLGGGSGFVHNFLCGNLHSLHEELGREGLRRRSKNGTPSNALVRSKLLFPLPLPFQLSFSHQFGMAGEE